MTPAEATSLMTTLSSQARVIEVDELEERIARLEKARGQKN
jgi:hypothetical protein